MKNMIFGIALFVTGFFGAIALIFSAVISRLNPWTYEGITGWRGVVLGMELQVPLIICIVVSAIGIVLCVIEAIRKDQ